jgi:hypothetical protein
MERRLGRLASFAGIVAAIALVSVPSAGTSGIGDGLFAFVRADAPGPVTACADASNCTAANTVWHFIYVANVNQLMEVPTGPRTRTTLRNSFVVSSVEMRAFVDGVEFGSPAVFTPPPNPNPRTWAGHWPSTVRCQGAPEIPCVVENPAVVPGEVAEVVFAGWVHGADEPNGRYVFKFAVHGTLNGSPVVVRANSRPIEMTD